MKFKEFGSFRVRQPHVVDDYGDKVVLKGYAVALPHQCDEWEIAGDWHGYSSPVDLDKAIEQLASFLGHGQNALTYLFELKDKLAKTGCPNDTDGDGNCGKVACPHCGKHRKEQTQMLLCKCMNKDCPNVHWADLSHDEKAKLLAGGNAVTVRDDTTDESKRWPPVDMETK